MSYQVNKLTTNTKKRRDLILRTIPLHSLPRQIKIISFCECEENETIYRSKFAMMKLIWVFVVLAVLVISQPFSSNAAKKAQKGKFVVKQISNKLKTVCPSQKKNLKQVLSIVSSVDLTLRFTHSRISSLETAAKRLNKGT